MLSMRALETIKKPTASKFIMLHFISSAFSPPYRILEFGQRLTRLKTICKMFSIHVFHSEVPKVPKFYNIIIFTTIFDGLFAERFPKHKIFCKSCFCLHGACNIFNCMQPGSIAEAKWPKMLFSVEALEMFESSIPLL